MPLSEWHLPFLSFSANSGAKPLVLVGRMQILHVRRFRQTPPFLAGDKNLRHGASGTISILKKRSDYLGLNFWLPTNSESRSVDRSENWASTQLRSWVQFQELLRACPGSPRVAPRMAFHSESVFSPTFSLQNWGGSKASD